MSKILPENVNPVDCACQTTMTHVRNLADQRNKLSEILEQITVLHESATMNMTLPNYSLVSYMSNIGLAESDISTAIDRINWALAEYNAQIAHDEMLIAEGNAHLAHGPYVAIKGVDKPQS